MPKGSSHRSKESTRILIVGDPGAGKTCAYGSLLAHGQRLFVCDFDDNLDPIFKLVPKEFHDNLIYETLVDKVRFDKEGNPTVEGRPTAFAGFVKLVKSWVDSETGEDYGPPESWGPNDWLVIDPLTSFSHAAMWHTLHKAGRLGTSMKGGRPRRLKDWGVAIDKVEGAIQMLRSLPINMIVTAHLMRLSQDEIEDDEESGGASGKPAAARKLPDNLLMRYPATLGQKLPPRIGGYFSVVLQAKRVGKGQAARRVLATVPDDDVDVKVPVPPKSLPVEVPADSLWTIVEALRK